MLRRQLKQCATTQSRQAVAAAIVGHQITTIPVGKAVPTTSAPVSAWKSLQAGAHAQLVFPQSTLVGEQ